MLLYLVRKELLNNLLNAKFLVCYAVVFVLTMLSVMNMGTKYARDHKAYRVNGARFLADNRKAGNLGASCKYHVQIPPARLRVFSMGFDREITDPHYVSLAHPGEYGQYSNADPVRAQYPLYDLGFIVAVVMSLMTVFMSFDCLNGEKRQGTLRLLFTNPVGRNAVIAGKLIGGYVTLMLPFVLAWLVALTALLTVFGIAFTGTEWVRMLLMGGLAGLYVAVFFMLSALFSAWFDEPSRSLLGLVTVWIALVAVLPNVSFALTKAALRVPTEGDLLRERKVMDKVESDRAYAFEAALRKAKGPKSNWSLEDNIANQKVWLARWENRVKGWGLMLEAQRQKLEHRMRIGTLVARISPAAGFLFGFSHLAGTGVNDFIDAEHWKHGLTKRTVRVEMEEQARRRAATPMNDFFKQLDVIGKDPIDPNLLPSRHYDRAGLRTALARVRGDAALLALELVLLFMGTYMVFVRRRTV